MINKIKKIYTNLVSIFKYKSYLSCDTLFKYNFDKITETEDYRWLLHKFNENSNIELSKKRIEELKLVWQNIFEEYVKLKGDQSVINNLRKRASVLNLQNRMYWGSTLIKIIINNPKTKNLEKVQDELIKWKFKVDKTKSLEKQIESVTTQLKHLRTRFNIESKKMEEIALKMENKGKSNPQEQVRAIEKVLELKYPLNTKEITISQWISYVRNAEQVIRDKKIENNGRKN